MSLPAPEGHLNISYDPMSPPNFGMVAAEIQIFVYANVRVALQALMQSATEIQAQRLRSGSVEIFSGHLFFRGQCEVTQRLLPTRLRGSRREPLARRRTSIGAVDDATREHFGNWSERVEPVRRIEDSLDEVQGDLAARDRIEAAAIERARQVREVAELDPFRQRAALRHYGNIPSPLLDLSTNPEVAAFFATGGKSPPRAGTIGMLWAIDLNFLSSLFSLDTTSAPGGEKTSLTAQPDGWGDNKKMFEEYGILPPRLELDSVALPFRRPQAQHAQFLSLAGEKGAPLPAKTEIAWWSIIERYAYPCAFVQDGQPYENIAHNITADVLLPEDEPLAEALGKAPAVS